MVRWLRMRTWRPRVILWPMGGHTGDDRRRSASANAALLLAAALIPVLGAIDTSRIDPREARPWGCRTCIIPNAPLPAAEGDSDPL